MIGQTISHYRITDQLGAGGMGVVYAAEDLELKRPVALKFLSGDATEDPEARARLLNEAQAAAALDHPNVCTVYEIDRTESRPFIAMALIEGRTLKERIAEGPLPLDRVLEIAVQAAEGLGHAHEKSIVHRDVKPSNLMLALDGQVRILDFGLARATGQAHLTRTGTTLGTVSYMSPEQAGGAEVDRRTDIWSLGVVLYEMIAGRRPFGGEHQQAIIYALRTEDPEPLTGIRTGVPVELERIVGKCLAKRPEERYQTAADLLADLRRLWRITDEGTASLQSGPATVWGSSRARAWSVAALALLVLVAGFVLSRVLLPPGVDADERKMIAVLPLENLGPAEDEYFADGLTEEITSRLAGLRGLGVISRTSTLRYKSERPALQQIGRELGVEYVLEGTVRWEHRDDGTSRVLVTPQLIRVADDTHLWSDRYTRDLSEIFAVQADIASEVARELDVTLLERERTALAAHPTENLEAYQAYLRGLQALKNPNSREADFLVAETEFERAIALDPRFTMAHVRLGEAHCELIFWAYDRSEARVGKAAAALEQAAALEPDLPEVHRGLGSYYYMVHKDLDRALAEFAIAGEGLPNDPELLESTAYIMRRRGRFTEAFAELDRAAGLDPRNAWLRMQLGYTCSVIRQYEAAARYYSESIALEADQIVVYVFMALNHLLWNGDPDAARATIEAAPDQGTPLTIMAWYALEMTARNYTVALDRVSHLSDDEYGSAGWITVKPLLAGKTYHAMGDRDRALASFAEAVPIMEEMVQAFPGEGSVHSALGEAYAGAGRRTDALSAGAAGIELARDDALTVGSRYLDLAEIHGLLEEHDAAIAWLDSALAVPGITSIHMIDVSPLFDPLRDLPQYRRLMERYAGE